MKRLMQLSLMICGAFLVVMGSLFVRNINAAPNPASINCIEKGGRLEIRRAPIWPNEYGICKFDDGSECNEWGFFKGECKKGQYNKIIPVYDCSMCSGVKAKIGDRSPIIENEEDYKGINFNDKDHNLGWYFLNCCKGELKKTPYGDVRNNDNPITQAYTSYSVTGFKPWPLSSPSTFVVSTAKVPLGETVIRHEINGKWYIDVGFGKTGIQSMDSIWLAVATAKPGDTIRVRDLEFDHSNNSFGQGQGSDCIMLKSDISILGGYNDNGTRGPKKTVLNGTFTACDVKNLIIDGFQMMSNKHNVLLGLDRSDNITITNNILNSTYTNDDPNAPGYAIKLLNTSHVTLQNNDISARIGIWSWLMDNDVPAIDNNKFTGVVWECDYGSTYLYNEKQCLCSYH